MNTTKQLAVGKIELLLGTTVAAVLTGCVGHVDEPRGGGAYVEPPSAYVESVAVVQPEYVYYPAYEVYYSGHTRQYVYRQGRSWVSRPEPPRVSANVLLASPSVRLDFHDSPALHHATVTRQYPKHWTPQSESRGQTQPHDQERR